MKQRFRARELWLFAPFLLFGVAALLYWRWEQVTPKDERGFYVSDVQLVPANGIDEERGISHYVTTRLSHSWPKPRWWGELPKAPYWLDPLNSTKPPQNYYGYKIPYDMATGGLLTVMRANKTIKVSDHYGNYPGEISFDGRSYIIKRGFSLRPLPQDVGEIKFEGIYQWKGGPTVKVSRVVRAQSAKLPAAKARNSGARIVSVTASPYQVDKIVNMQGATETSAASQIEIIVQHTLPVPKGKAKHSIRVYDQELQDSRAPNQKPNEMLGISTTAHPSPRLPTKPLKPNQSHEIFDVILEESNATVGPITLHGKISADEHWPLSFEVKLPPRPAATAPAK